MQSSAAPQPPHDRLIIALDVDTTEAVLGLIDRLGDAACFYKVGLQLLTAHGPAIVRALRERDKHVFLDLKLHEIPTSVALAVRAAGALGVEMVTVHALGGSAVLRAAVDAARPFPALKVLALTVITSLNDQDLNDLGFRDSVDTQVLRLAALACESGCHGVIASPREVGRLRAALPSSSLIVTPGTQLDHSATRDHVRTATPRAAIADGATHLIMGRTIVTAEDPRTAFQTVCAEVAHGLKDAGAST